MCLSQLIHVVVNQIQAQTCGVGVELAGSEGQTFIIRKVALDMDALLFVKECESFCDLLWRSIKWIYTIGQEACLFEALNQCGLHCRADIRSNQEVALVMRALHHGCEYESSQSRPRPCIKVASWLIGQRLVVKWDDELSCELLKYGRVKWGKLVPFLL